MMFEQKTQTRSMASLSVPRNHTAFGLSGYFSTRKGRDADFLWNVRNILALIPATNTNVVLFDGDLLEPGQHVTGIIGGNMQLVQGGFLKAARREIDDRTVERADIVATNLRESVMSEKQGDLYEPIERGITKLEDIIELGALATGEALGRNNDEEITYHKNNNGTAASETAVAMLVYEKAKAAGRGTMIDLIDPVALQEEFAQ